MYAKTHLEYEEDLVEMRECASCAKYPQYMTYLEKCYGNRPEAWATYSRIERQLPTHGSNTTAYAEISMKLTKETVFGRQKARNLPEMLSIICDNSEPYVNKLIEIGNNRCNLLRKAKSKYGGSESPVTKEQIVDLGNGGYLVQSSKYEDLWYTCNLKNGSCTCQKGINSAPCHHKNAIAKHFNTSEFSVVPIYDPCQQAMYHFIATGTTLQPHMYRRRGDAQAIPDISKYIQERLLKKLPAEIETFEHEAEVEMEEQQGGTSDHEVENREGEEENKKVKALFLKSLLEYGEKVSALNDPNSIKAMKAMTRTLKKSMNCNPHTIQQQLHLFGKGGAAARKSKWGRVINPNPPAIASRLAPGSGPAPLGRRFKDRRGQVVTLQGGQVVRAGNPPVYQNRRPHSLTLAISDNARSAR